MEVLLVQRRARQAVRQVRGGPAGACARERGFVLYPGKLTQVETFRVGCIGAIGPGEMEQAAHAIAGALQDMGISSAAPAH